MTTTETKPEGLPPLNLAGGSYDYEKLYGAADKAMEIQDPEKRQAYLDKVVIDHDHNKTASIDPSATPGYERKEVTTELADGVTVTENIQVPNHDPKKHPLPDPDAPASPAKATGDDTKPSSAPAPTTKKD